MTTGGDLLDRWSRLVLVGPDKRREVLDLLTPVFDLDGLQPGTWQVEVVCGSRRAGASRTRTFRLDPLILRVGEQDVELRLEPWHEVDGER